MAINFRSVIGELEINNGEIKQLFGILQCGFIYQSGYFFNKLLIWIKVLQFKKSLKKKEKKNVEQCCCC